MQTLESQSCFCAVMISEQGPWSCCHQFSSVGGGGPASLPADNCEGLRKRTAAHQGIPWQQLCQRPPKWSVNEMTGHILTFAPWRQETDKVTGERKYQCESVRRWFNMSTVLKQTQERLLLRSSSTKACLLNTAWGEKPKKVRCMENRLGVGWQRSERKRLIVKRDAHARPSHRGLSKLRRYELNSVVWGFWKDQKWHFHRPQGTSCLDCF